MNQIFLKTPTIETFAWKYNVHFITYLSDEKIENKFSSTVKKQHSNSEIYMFFSSYLSTSLRLIICRLHNASPFAAAHIIRICHVCISFFYWLVSADLGECDAYQVFVFVLFFFFHLPLSPVCLASWLVRTQQTENKLHTYQYIVENQLRLIAYISSLLLFSFANTA